AALIPWLGNAVYILSGRAPLRLDPTPLFFIISCTAMAWGLFRFDLLNLLPVAREAVIENMEDAVLVLDGGDRVVDLNPAALALCKGSPSSIVGHRLQETAFPGRETFQRYLHMLAARAEVTVDTPDGHLALDFRLSPLKDRRGRVRGRLILLRDVTERVRAEERLRENLALLSALIDSLRIAAMVEDDHGTIVHANRMAHILFPELCTASQPLPAEGAVLARLADLVAEPALLTGQIVEPFQNGQTIAPVEMPLRDGRILECEVIPLPMNQEHHGRLWLWRDVTERRHQEQLARQRHKMEAIGRLAGGIAHDFNNLLTVINGYSQLVWRALPAESPLREKLMRIRQAGDEAANLTRQLLLFSRPPTLKAGPQDLNAVVRDMQRMLSHLLGKRITLEIALAPGLRPVWSDVSYLEELLVNLATNARDAIYALPALDGEEDRVRIETASRIIEPGAPETHEGLAPGEYVLLSVSDNGRGLTSEEQAHLFEPFYTCQTLGEGTGLALAVVYGLVEQLGGTIRVESRPDRGSTFNVLLPCVSQSEEERSYALDVDSSAR
ncbi:MAG: PAS domain-containing protein, partial [Chloroflexi bacterium]|nr:PAS domain-containing protein [Chloroflexota bacterium]